MEHLISDEEFDALTGYYVGKYKELVEKRKLAPAEACVVLLVSVLDTALRTVFSEEDEQLSELDERVSTLEGKLR